MLFTATGCVGGASGKKIHLAFYMWEMLGRDAPRAGVPPPITSHPGSFYTQPTDRSRHSGVALDNTEPCKKSRQEQSI